MKLSEYKQHDALALAQLVKQREVSPLELMQCAITLAQTQAEPLNALIYPRFEAALERARHWQSQGVFAGVPFLLKDSSLGAKDFPASVGSKLFQDLQFAENSTLAQRFEDAGLIPFARSTVPEFCMAPTTEAALNQGPTLNPWDSTRSPGGSSGGAAAAIAVGVVPLAHGSDGGGSIRIPAACCGLFGLKPSRGLVPTGPQKGEIWGGLGTDGVLSVSVRDSAAAMDSLCAPEAGSPYAAPSFAPGTFLGAALAPRVHGLRIALWKNAWDDIPVAPECRSAVLHTAKLLQDIGHHVEEAPLMDWDYEQFVQAHYNILTAHATNATEARLQALQRPLRDDDLEPALKDAYEEGKRLSASDYINAIATLHDVGRRLGRYLKDYDLILTPSLTQLPVPLGELSMQGSFWSLRRKVSRYATFMALVNASGAAAASLPLWQTGQPLPVGSQLIGPLGSDALIIGVAAQLEQAQPWHHQRPPQYFAS